MLIKSLEQASGRRWTVARQDRLHWQVEDTFFRKSFLAYALWPTRSVTAATPRFLRAPRNCSAT